MAKSRERMYQEHEANCDERGVHPDGCFYCGGDHPSDCCGSDERHLFWAPEDEEFLEVAERRKLAANSHKQ